VQSARFIEAHGGRPEKISISGQERNQATWRIGKLNLAIHGLSGEIKYTQRGSLLDEAFPTLKADFVMANPPFNLSDLSWQHKVVDPRRRAAGHNATHGQRELRLAPALPVSPCARCAGRILHANGSLTTMTGGEAKIRESLVRADVVDWIVALPPLPSYATAIPVCL